MTITDDRPDTAAQHSVPELAEAVPWPDDTPMEELGLRTRTRRVLARVGYRTLGDLRRLPGDRHLAAEPDIGAATMDELRTVLADAARGRRRHTASAGLAEVGVRPQHVPTWESHGYATVADFKKVDHIGRLAALPGVGPGLLAEIQEKLAAVGVRLRPAPASPQEAGIGPTEHACIMAMLIPAGSATPDQLAGALDLPEEEVKEGLDILAQDGWVARRRFGGEWRYWVPRPQVVVFRKWSRTHRRQCGHGRHTPNW